MVWDKLKKVNGSNKPRIVPHWRREERWLPDITKLQKFLQTTIQKFQEIYTWLKEINKRKQQDNQMYNYPFIERKLKAAIKQQKNTAPGEDTIHPQMIKMLPPETLKYLLDL